MAFAKLIGSSLWAHTPPAALAEPMDSSQAPEAVDVLAWRAPETFLGVFDEMTDAFSFGSTLYEIATRAVPWSGHPPDQVQAAVQTRFDCKGLGETVTKALAGPEYEAWLGKHPVAARRPPLDLLQVWYLLLA